MFGSAKKFLLIGFLLVLLAAIPLTVFFLQTQQQTQTHATAATNLSFTQTTPGTTIKVNDEFDVDVMLDPGTNQVIATKLVITYDPTKLQGVSITPNASAFSSTLEGPTLTSGTMSITLTIGVDVTKAIQTKTKAATIKLKALAEGTSSLTFSDQSNVTSTSDPETNVIALKTPLAITVGAGATVAPTAGPTVAATPATCIALNVDRAPKGEAPFSITFGATATKTGGTITKVTFNFGDGSTQDVTQDGGVGTGNVNANVSHTYRNAGTYDAFVVFTDSTGAVTTKTPACTKPIEVTTAQTGVVPTTPPIGGAVPTPTAVVVTATPSPTPVVVVSMKPSGPGDSVVRVGILGAVLSIVGGLVFFAL